MYENIDLIKILKYCLTGTKLYSLIYGNVELYKISNDKKYPIFVKLSDDTIDCLSKDGRYCCNYDGECTLFPSRDQRDWSKFTAPWLKKGRFDPKTLNVFDKVLTKISNEYYCTWFGDFVSEPAHVKNETPLIIGAKEADMVIPYNDETKYLVGTTEEAPEYYRY